MTFPAITRHLTSGDLSTPAIGTHFLIAALKGDPMSLPRVLDMLDAETRFEASLLISYGSDVRDVFLHSFTTLLPACPVAQATLPTLTHLVSRHACGCRTPVPTRPLQHLVAELGGSAHDLGLVGHPSPSRATPTSSMP